MPAYSPARRHLLAIALAILSAAALLPLELWAQEHASALSIAKVPIAFEPNAGQAETSTRFLARAMNAQLRLRSDGFELSLKGPGAEVMRASFAFLNVPSQSRVAGEIPESGQTNYLIGRDPSHWITHVPNFQQVRYSGLYPKIDLVFHGNGSQLEHDFVVSPGGDVSAIRMHMLSRGGLARNPDGSIKISTESGDLLLTNPSIYQLADGRKEPRRGRFVLTRQDEIGFEVGEYDHTRPLIIDPVLVFSTFLAPDEIFTSGVATDTAGNTYITGLAFSSSSPAATSNAFQKACDSCNNSTSDVFVMKLDSTGSQALYCTFLGGSNYDQPNAIAVDANGNAIVTGYTASTDFPVKNSGPFGYAGNGTDYGFVASLSADGSSLNYSSLLGGGAQQLQSSTTFPTALGLDSSGNAYVAGVTHSPYPPVTAGALNAMGSAYPNLVFLTKFLTDGTLAYSALVGDTAIVQGGGCCFSGAMRVKVDSSGSAYIFGRSGALWPTTPGAYQTQIPAPSNEAVFVTKVSPDASQLIYSTFVGPDTLPHGLDIDPSGDAFITGAVNTSFPVTSNAYQSTLPGTCCASYLAELDPTGSKLLYSTYFTGIGSIAPGTSFDSLSPTVQLDPNGDIWLAGTTTDVGLPLVHPLQSTLSSTAPTGFVSEFDPTGTNLLFSTYFGSFSQGSQSIDLAIDPRGKAHIAGVTGTDLYVNPTAFLTSVNPPAPNTRPVWGFAAVIDGTAPAPELCLSSNTSLFFGRIVAGTSRSIAVTATNCGNSTSSLTINGIAASSPTFTVPAANNNCLTSLAANATCTFLVAFSPTSAGAFSATLTLSANTPIPQTTIGLSGGGTVPVIQLNTTSINFDPLYVGQTGSHRVIIIYNAGQANLIIDPTNTTIGPAPTFTMQSGCTQPVPPNQSCGLLLTFSAPIKAGTYTGTLSIASNDPANPLVTVSLSGTALSSYTVPAITSIDHPTVPINSGPVTLSVLGQNFFPSSTIFVNGVAQQTTYSSAYFVSAQLSSSLFSAMGELTITVMNPTPGGGTSNAVLLTVYRFVRLTPAGLIYDPRTQLLYASIPANAAANPNSIISIDPVTGNTGSPIPVGNDPRQLALSQDGSYLYVAVNGDHAVQRINMGKLAVDATFPLPTPPAGAPGAFPLTVSDLKVVPGTSQSFVVSLLVPVVSPPEAGIALYNGSGLVNWLPSRLFSNNSTAVAVDSFAFAGNPPLVYSLPGTAIFFGAFTVDSSGIHSATPAPVNSTGPTPSGLVASDGTLLFTGSGQVWNPTTEAFIGTYNPSSSLGSFVAYSVVPDDSEGRTFFLNPIAQYDQQSAVSVDAYDQTTFQKVGAVSFFSASVPSTNVLGLTRWGSNGLAFGVGNFTPALGSNQLVIFQSSIAGSAAATQTSISFSSANSTFGEIVIVTAAVTATNNPVTSGNVAFFDNGTQIGTGTLDSSGHATFSTSSLPPGQHALSVVFSGSTGFEGSISAAVTETVVGVPDSSLNPTGLSFGGQMIGTTSAAQTITLTNPGSAALAISAIAVAGADSGDFTTTSATTCPVAGGTVAAGSTCIIEITFTPRAAGARNASLIVTDNASDSPQSAGLSGLTSDLSISPAPEGSTSATITAGQTATFNLEISAVNDFSGSVTLTCSGAPAGATCSVNPPVLTVANSSVPFTVSIATASRSVAEPLAERRFRFPIIARTQAWESSLGGLLVVLFIMSWRFGVRRRAALLGSVAALCLLLISCSGGGSPVSSAPPANSPGTPAGSYSLSVNAASGNMVRTIPLTLNVQ